MTKTTPKAPKTAKAARKAPVKKAVTTPIKTAQRKTPAKAAAKAVTSKAKVSAPKAATKKPTIKKTPTKKSPAKVAAKKTQTRTAAPAKASTPAKRDLQTALASLETRMKRADTLTRKSVESLEKAVLALDARTRKENSTGKAALTRRINQLSAKLTDMVSQTEASVNAELKTALQNPTVENLQAALSRADQRLSTAEQHQAEAISKVNRHLSAIATAVDARIEDEAKARLASIAALKTETQNAQSTLSERIDTIEADTAQALSRTGEQIAELSEQLVRRGEATEVSIREKVSEIALQTQAEFESYRAGLERRIDDAAQRSSTDHETQRLERSIASLTARLDGLEYAVANSGSVEAPSIDLTREAPPPPSPQLSLVASQATPQPLSSVAPMAPTVLADAFTPLAPVSESASDAMPNPYLAAETQAITTEQAAPPAQDGPVEFDPRNFMPKKAGPTQRPVPAEPARDFTQASLVPPPPADPRIQAPHQGATPYADPAYAENDPTMARVRIGGENTPKFNLPKLTGRNLRVAAIATGVAVVGLVAAKGVFGGDDNAPLPQQTAQNIPPQNNVAPVSIPTPDTSIAPIGNYEDNRAVEVKPSSEAAKSLNAAAAAGDKVAQFQLGLSYLEQGRTNEGVDLIRKSANQNQPAAQYRLANCLRAGKACRKMSMTPLSGIPSPRGKVINLPKRA